MYLIVEIVITMNKNLRKYYNKYNIFMKHKKGGEKTNINKEELNKSMKNDNQLNENYDSVEIPNVSLQKINNNVNKDKDDAINKELDKFNKMLSEANEKGMDTSGIEDKIKELKNNKKLDKGDLLNLMKNDLRGVRIYVHPKPYADYPWPWETSRKQNYISKVNYEIFGRDNPYARVDENMRQLKLYTWNDAQPDYITNVDPNDGNIESTLNTEKKNPNRYFQYVSKDIFLHPNTKLQTGIEGVDKMTKTKGGRLRRTKNKKRNSKKKNRRRNKTKRYKKI